MLKTFRRTGLAAIAGGTLMQGCVIGGDEIRASIGDSLQLVILDLFTTALSGWLDALLNVS